MSSYPGVCPSRSPRCFSRVLAAFGVLFGCLVATTTASAALVSFPVASPQGTITQDNVGSNVSALSLGAINIGTGTFSLGSITAPAFGIGLNPTVAPVNQWFFTQENNNVAWLVSGGEVSLLPSGSTVGSGGTFTSSDPFFASVWRSGVSSGYAGLRLQFGSDFYYGYATIDYVVGTPNQATVSSFAFENVANTPVAVPEPNALLAVGAGAVVLAGVHFRRRTRRSCRWS